LDPRLGVGTSRRGVTVGNEFFERWGHILIMPRPGAAGLRGRLSEHRVGEVEVAVEADEIQVLLPRLMQNMRRGHYELGVEADPRLRVRAAFTELTETI
jgi:hypothetical protein